MKIVPFIFCTILISLSCNFRAQDTTPIQSVKSSWALLPFTKVDSVNPILTPSDNAFFDDPILNKKIKWEAKDVFNPAAIIRNDTLFLLYRAEDSIGKFAGTSRIGLAYSNDGLHFTKHPTPVFYPDNDAFKKWEWEGGCEDPRVVQNEEGMYFMTYTSYDGDKARLMIATSANLYHWTKHGPAFANAGNGKFIDTWSKSGSIISDYENGTPVAKKINGKYWMYWGDTDIFLATSDDLIGWTPVTANDKIIPVFGPRPGEFDSQLVEPGPPAIITKNGILLLYNSRNKLPGGDTSLADGTYAAGQALLDVKNPGIIIDRLPGYFINPDKPYEIEGQVNQVCFLEGLVHYKNKWFLYYGTADSKIAVATKN